MELTKRSMDEMIANFNREVSCMDLSVADKIKILGMITAIGFRYKEDVQFVHAIPTAQPEIIRCRNCKFASGDSRICMKFDHSPIGELDFCAWAERRTDEMQ